MKTFGSIHPPIRLRWLLMLAALIIPQMVHADSWKAFVGAQSHDKGTQALAFLPNEIWIHAGDSITWTFAADEIHTVTFLTPLQPRPIFQVGCPGTSPSGSSFDNSMCVTTGPMTTPGTFSVTFPRAGNFKLICLVHANMTGVVHVLDPSQPLPHDQDFYNRQAFAEARNLITDTDHNLNESNDEHSSADHASADRSSHNHSKNNNVTVGIGEIVATPGGQQTLSILRFIHPTTVIHVGDTVEWGGSDPVTPHTVTFGPAADPANPIPPSANVTVDEDGALHAVINAPTDNVHSGLLVAAPQERIGLALSPITPTRFRVTFTHTGTFPFRCVLHDNLGMIGKVVVQK